MNDYVLAYKLHEDQSYDPPLYLKNNYHNIASFISQQINDQYLFTNEFDQGMFTTSGQFLFRVNDEFKEIREPLVSELNRISFGEIEASPVEYKGGITYKVTIEEQLSKTIEVDANSLEEAEQIANKMYKNEEIVLCADDFVDVEIYADEVELQVLIVKPQKEPQVAKLPNTYEAITQTVEGHMERAFPFDDPNVCVIVNEEGLLRQLEPNRGFKNFNGEITNLFVGNMIVCGVDKYGENTSLSKSQLDNYKELLKPQKFFFNEKGNIDFKEIDDKPKSKERS